MKHQITQTLKVGLASFLSLVLTGVLPAGAAYAQTLEDQTTTQAIVETVAPSAEAEAVVPEEIKPGVVPAPVAEPAPVTEPVPVPEVIAPVVPAETQAKVAEPVIQPQTQLSPILGESSALTVQDKKVKDEPKGNNGTLQVHEYGDEDYKPGNQPQVCHFNFEAFKLDKNQTGDVVITKQAPTQPKGEVVLTLSLSTDEDGNGATAYINGENEQLSLPNGHYKATLDNKFGTDQNGKAKSKVFWVTCPVQQPTVVAVVLECVKDEETSRVRVNITNNTDVKVTYTVTLKSGDKTYTETVKIAAGQTGKVVFEELPVGKYSLTAKGSDGTKVAQREKITVVACEAEQKKPDVTAKVLDCREGDVSTRVRVRVTNNSDESVEYAITLRKGADKYVKKVVIAAHESGTRVFADLPVGEYTVRVVGDDETSVRLKDKVTVEACEQEEQPKLPAVAAAIVPCIEDSGENDTVKVTVTNTDDETNGSVTYEVTFAGQTQTVTNLGDGASQIVTFSGLTPGIYTAKVVGSDGTVTSNAVTVKTCPTGDVLGVTTGGQGAGEVMGKKVTVFEQQLANTGEAQNPFVNIIAGFAILAMTIGVAVLARKRETS